MTGSARSFSLRPSHPPTHYGTADAASPSWCWLGVPLMISSSCSPVLAKADAEGASTTETHCNVHCADPSISSEGTPLKYASPFPNFILGPLLTDWLKGRSRSRPTAAGWPASGWLLRPRRKKLEP